MQVSLFLKIFALIFLAELGDKTQLATMASAADQPQARMTILIAASAALVASTLVAVFFGAQITRWIPERVIKIAAGILFLLFGLLILREGFATKPAKVAAEAVPAVFPRVGAVGRRILSEAVELERLAFEDYHALAAKVQDPELRRVLQEIAGEEDEHRRMLLAADRATMQAVAPPASLEALPAQAELAHHVAQDDQPILEHAIEHELGMAAFYRQLSRIAVVPSLRQACTTIAAAEESHARRLRKFQA